MSLVKITEKIEQEARAEAEAIISSARELEAQILRDAREEVDKLKNETQERLDRDRPEIFRRREIVSELDIEKLRLRAQWKLIQDVYDQVMLELRNLEKDAYLKFCAQLLAAASETGNETLIIATDEKYIDQSWLERFNNERRTNITLAEQRQNISGGFILENERISVNCSWDMLLLNVKENMETEVVKRLFPA